MCTYNTLYHDAGNGYAIKCMQCNNIQLAFGNVCITFPEEEFDSFFALIKRFAANLSHTVVVQAKTIYIPTPCNNVKLLLSHAGLNELVIMLDAAENELRALQMLSLFNIQAGNI